MRKVNRNIFWLLLYGAWIALVFLLLGSCGTGKTAITPDQRARLDALVENRNFRFEAEFAIPLASQAYMNAANIGITQVRGNSVNHISLMGDGYYLTLSGDSVQSYLPYFGVRRNITDYTGRGGIEIDGPVTDLEVSQIPKGSVLEFRARDNYEQFRVILLLFANREAQITVFSPQRDVIRYTGKISPEVP